MQEEHIIIMKRKKIVVRLSDNSLSNTIFDSIGGNFQNTLDKIKIPDMNIGINPDTKELVSGLLTGKTKLPTVMVGLDQDTRKLIDTSIKTISASIAFVGILSYLKSKNQ